MTYADTFNLRDRSLAKINDIADAIDGQLLDRYSINKNNSSTSTSSTTMVDTDLTLSITLGAQQSVLLIASIGFSISAVTYGAFQLVRDTTDIGAPQYLTTHRADTNALDMNAMLVSSDSKPGAGTYTYKVQWLTTTSNTIYSRFRQLEALVFQE